MNFLKVYPETIVVGNVKTFKMIEQFFGVDIEKKLIEIILRKDSVERNLREINKGLIENKKKCERYSDNFLIKTS